MDWKAEYQKKLMTAEAAVDRIKSGDRVVIGHAVGQPTALVRRDGQERRELQERRDRAHGSDG